MGRGGLIAPLYITMKGIVLSGGSGTRLYPMTRTVCKQLLPVYDKPMIYYPLSTLMLAGIRDILIISTPDDTHKFRDMFGDGKELGLTLGYAIQKKPSGIAEALIIADDYFGGQKDVALILGDNIFYGHLLVESMINAQKIIASNGGAVVFSYQVKDPERYGVVTFNENGNVNTIEEKPSKPKSNHAVVGLYFYDYKNAAIAKSIKPSARGELEITDVNRLYMELGELRVKHLGRGTAWLDTGTPESLIEAASFIRTIQDRQGLMIGCLEEIAYHNKWIDEERLKHLAGLINKTAYGKYLLDLLEK